MESVVFKDLMVATDGSEGAWEAFKQASEFYDNS